MFQFSSVAQLCLPLCDPVNRSTPGLPVHHRLLEFTQTHVHWGGDAIQPSHPVIPFSSHFQSFSASGSFPMSQLELGGLRIRWPKYWSFSFSISLSNAYSGLISFRMDWLDLLAVHGTQESSLTQQFKSINFLALKLSLKESNSHIHTLLKKP